jgi:hypothetical protein
MGFAIQQPVRPEIAHQFRPRRHAIRPIIRPKKIRQTARRLESSFCDVYTFRRHPAIAGGPITMKTFTPLLLAGSLLLLGAVTAPAASNSAGATASASPKSIMHVVTVAWKDGTTPEQIKAAIDGVQKLPSQFKGITRVWTKTVKVQNPPGAIVKKSHVFAMEFADAAALEAYEGSPAQLEWYKSYMPIRETSTTYDISN